MVLMQGEVACAIIAQRVRLTFQPPILSIRAHMEFSSQFEKISFQPNLTQRRPDWLSDYLVKLLNSHLDSKTISMALLFTIIFMKKSLTIEAHQLFMHNILSTTGVDIYHVCILNEMI